MSGSPLETRAWASENNRATSLGMKFLDLPDECIAKTLSRLDTPRDVVACEAACRRLWLLGREPAVWLEKLKKTFDLRVQATQQGEPPDWQKLYGNVSSSSADSLLRFAGVFTDGGCDNNLALYWVDNLFTANNWHAYCSAVRKNVDCIGLLTGADEHAHSPQAELQHREYIIDRCILPNGFISRNLLPVGPNGVGQVELMAARQALSRCSTSELEHLLAEIYTLYQQGMAVGKLLFFNIPADRLRAEVEKVDGIVRQMARSEDRSLRQAGISARKEMDVLMDGPALKRLAADRDNRRHAGIIHSIAVNRVGSFSCPVKTGVVFAANVPMPTDPGTAFESAANSFAALLRTKLAKRFTGILHDIELFKGIRDGSVPPIISSQCNHAGVWLEFDPAWQGSEELAAGGLRPILWFRFWAKDEAYSYFSLCKALGRDPVDGRRLADPASSYLENLEYFKMQSSGCFTESHSRASMTPEEWLERIQQEFIGWEYMVSQEEFLDLRASVGAYEDNFINEVVDGALKVTDHRLNINHLEMKLKEAHAGNCATVQLINQEDLMEEWIDTHDQPNIDVTYVSFQGRQVLLPEGAQLRH